MTNSTTNHRLLSSSYSSLLLVLFLAANNSVGCDGFTIPPSTTLSASSTVNHYQTYTTTILQSEKDASNNDVDADSEPPTQQSPPQQQQASSDLKALLPKPAVRPLQLDKFGRRIYRMDDDTTVRHTKGGGSSGSSSSSSSGGGAGGGGGGEKSIGGDRASTDYTTSTDNATSRFGMGTEPKSLTRQNNPPPEQMKSVPIHDANFVTDNNDSSGGGGGGVPLSELLTDSKQLAGDKSKETFDAVSSSSTDLKSLLPKQKMRFMKLDKFGRRVQRMEDDGTVSYTKSRVVDDDSNDGGVGEESADGGAGGGGDGEKVGAIRGVKSTSNTGVFTSGSEVEQPQPTFKTYVPSSTDTKEKEDVGQSLSKLLTDSKQLAGDKSKETLFDQVSSSTDLKALLPTQKMRFMKLDKFGRRVQRMEDDGTVSYTKSRPGDESGSSASMVDLGTEASTTTSGYGGGGEESGKAALSPSVNLKDLAGISKRPVFTKLDFKGGSVPDDRREKKSPVDNDVEDEAAPLSLSGLRELALSSKRPTFTKLDFHGTGVADERRIPKDTTSTAAAAEVTPTNKSNLKDLLPKRPTFTKLDFKGGNVADERRMKKSSSSSPAEPVGAATTTSSLKTLLPERKFMWKKEERRRTTTNDFIGSVGGDFIAKTTTAQMRQKAMRDEVVASASAESDEGGGNYSNLTNLLPKQKFVFRGGEVKGDDGNDESNNSNEEEGGSYSNLTDLI